MAPTYGEWVDAAEKAGKALSTFKRHRKDLMNRGRVSQVDNLYQATISLDDPGFGGEAIEGPPVH